MQKFRKI